LNDQLSLDVTYRDLVKGCLSDIDNCLSLFLSTSHFSGIVLDVDGANPFGVKRISRLFVMIVYAADVFNFGKLQLYPDVSPDNPYSYAVDIFTLLSFVQGYYKEMSSPFRAYQVITRMEATKVLLGSVGLIKWIPYSELEAALGGAGAVKNQKTVFADINSTREYMWWYPRYINLGCEVKMFDCVVGSNFRPDEFITEAEANKMLEELLLYVNVSSNYLETLNADDDKDLLKNYLEKDVYFTDPESKDTDYDGLSDKLEVYDYKTSPFLKDSDSDGLSDYEEVIINKTDPLKPDTDLDDFSDYVEVQSGTDPLSALSYPVDEDVNGVPDSWETENKVSVKDGAQDTDGDAISDKLEFQWGTDPNSRDTDGDGFTDTEEILEYNSDPLSVLSPGNLANIGVKITNFQENQLVADATPMIKGVAPFGYPVRILLRNDYGHEKILGSAIVDANNIFVFQSTEPLRDGRYMLVARSLQVNKKLIVESDPVHIIIDSSLDVAGPVPLKLDGEDVTPEVLLRNLKISIKDDRPVLTGQTEFGNKVTAVWKSVVISSVLIADSTTGEFLIQAPRNLGVGDHEVWLTAVRKKDSAQSETVKLNFKVEVPGLGDTIFRGVTEQMVPDIGFPLIGNLRVFVKEQGFLAWLVIGVTLFLMGALGWYVYMGRKK